MWDSLKSIIGNVAPTIATALGGPLAGGAVKLLTEALGIKDGSSESAIMDAVAKADPAALARIKQAELDYKTRIAELDVDLEKIASQDRDSARKREISVGGWSNPILATIVILGFLAAVWAVLSGNTVVDTFNAGLVGTVIGYISAKADQVVSYYFGSSKGSHAKDAVIAKMRP